MQTALTVAEAAALARTGDLFLFRGRTPADRAIRTVTNAPVNHVGMAVVLDDLPPLMWHAELSAGLTCMWSGTRHRGVQLHDLEQACDRWMTTYRQDGWLRQLSPAVGPDREDAVLRTIARMDGLAFPSTMALASRWVAGRLRTGGLGALGGSASSAALAEHAYCAEVVARSYLDMGLLDPDRPLNWYDPGRFWSGDELALEDGFLLGDEIALVCQSPAGHPSPAGDSPAEPGEPAATTEPGDWWRRLRRWGSARPAR